MSPRDPDEPAVWAFSQDAVGGGPVLSVHVFHGAVSRVLGATPDDAVTWALARLAEAIAGPVPAPVAVAVAVAVTSWADDPRSGGAYTHIPPGASPANADLLGEPVGGRLLFAGEHTQSARLAYADGAMTSGIREAKRLLGRPSVALGLHPDRREILTGRRAECICWSRTLITNHPPARERASCGAADRHVPVADLAAEPGRDVHVRPGVDIQRRPAGRGSRPVAERGQFPVPARRLVAAHGQPAAAER